MKDLYLIVDKSGSGKTTLVEELKKKGYTAVKSFTTRAKRTPTEDTYNFVSEEEFDALSDKLALGVYNGNKYCTTKSVLDNSDLYIVEPSGISDVFSVYSSGERKVHVMYVVMSEEKRHIMTVERCISEGKSNEEAEAFYQERCITDEQVFSKYLHHVDYTIVNNGSVDDLIANALFYIKNCEQAI